MRYQKNGTKQQVAGKHVPVAIVIPSEDLETQNNAWLVSCRIHFDENEIESFLRVRSFVQFREYCEKHDLVPIMGRGEPTIPII